MNLFRLLMVLIFSNFSHSHGNNLCHYTENHPNLHMLASSTNCGRTGRVGEMPWMVLLTVRGVNFCGGTLISRQHVLTAAHCTGAQDPNHIMVRVGEHTLGRRRDCDGDVSRFALLAEEYKVKQMILHEQFSWNTGYNDIALLLLQTDVQFRYDVQPICLPTSCKTLQENMVGKHVTVAGWDDTRSMGSKTLQKSGAAVLRTSTACPSYQVYEQGGYFKTLPSQMCAKSFGDSQSPCPGDSGGPLLFLRKFNGRRLILQVGIVSIGANSTYGCDSKTLEEHDHLPAIYTRVSYFMSWILDHLTDGI